MLIAVLAGAAVFGAWWRSRSGRWRSGRAQVPRVTGADLGMPLGDRATLLQFSSSFCAPCRATRALLAEVAAAAEGVRHVEVDVGDRLDLVRRLDVRRTPTVFVLGPDGRITRQASGQPRRDDVLAAVAQAAARNAEIAS